MFVDESVWIHFQNRVDTTSNYWSMLDIMMTSCYSIWMCNHHVSSCVQWLSTPRGSEEYPTRATCRETLQGRWGPPSKHLGKNYGGLSPWLEDSLKIHGWPLNHYIILHNCVMFLQFFLSFSCFLIILVSHGFCHFCDFCENLSFFSFYRFRETLSFFSFFLFFFFSVNSCCVGLCAGREGKEKKQKERKEGRKGGNKGRKGRFPRRVTWRKKRPKHGKQNKKQLQKTNRQTKK